LSNIYTSGEYLETTKTWHIEDSPWKANQILKIISKNNLHPMQIGEIGCRGGMILKELSEKKLLRDVNFKGYDISHQAIELCKQIENERVNFYYKIYCQKII
jgi:2-polyprenyl-3-methyl-5-hydroxy-6-metoxy-1,4-benzoquinol methylase